MASLAETVEAPEPKPKKILKIKISNGSTRVKTRRRESEARGTGHLDDSGSDGEEGEEALGHDDDVETLDSEEEIFRTTA
jgi:hypothetical protein